jgi:RNA polymerase sigma factor (sigma-70 family)
MLASLLQEALSLSIELSAARCRQSHCRAGRIRHSMTDEELYELVRAALRGPMRAKYGQDGDDRLHDAFLAARKAFRNGTLRNPGSLLAYAWGAARFTQWDEHRKARRTRGLGPVTAISATAERDLIAAERSTQALRLIRGLPAGDRAIITRFYLEGTPWRSICAELGLSDKQFRNRKSRALAKLRGRMYPHGHQNQGVAKGAPAQEAGRAAGQADPAREAAGSPEQRQRH